MKFRYTGDKDSTVLYGYTFVRGEAVTVDEAIGERLKRNDAYEIVNESAGHRNPETVGERTVDTKHRQSAGSIGGQPTKKPAKTVGKKRVSKKKRAGKKT